VVTIVVNFPEVFQRADAPFTDSFVSYFYNMLTVEPISSATGGVDGAGATGAPAAGAASSASGGESPPRTGDAS
jgi:hypothetical protein